MEKMKLALDEIEVTSFEIDETAEQADGTVFGQTTVDACFPTNPPRLTCTDACG